MANGNFGTIRTSDVNIDDIEVFYTYFPNRSTVSDNVKANRIDAATVLTAVKHPDNDDILGGMYNLKLPVDTFNNLGIYNIIIKPKEIRAKIADIGVLSSRPDVRGIVLDTSDPLVINYSSKLVNDGLTGYRIEYIDVNTSKKTPNIFRLVTSSNKCEPVSETATNSNQKSIRYRFNDVGNLLFLTLTPSNVSNIKANSMPFIGAVNQEIIIYNTYFDPIMLEIEMVDTTLETIKHGIYGNQVETKDGKLIIYTSDDKKDIYKIYDLVTVLDDYGKVTTKIKMESDTDDDSLNFNNIINSIN